MAARWWRMFLNPSLPPTLLCWNWIERKLGALGGGGGLAYRKLHTLAGNKNYALHCICSLAIMSYCNRIVYINCDTPYPDVSLHHWTCIKIIKACTMKFFPAWCGVAMCFLSHALCENYNNIIAPKCFLLIMNENVKRSLITSRFCCFMYFLLDIPYSWILYEKLNY